MKPRAPTSFAANLPLLVLLNCSLLVAQRNPDLRINTNPAGSATCNRSRVASAGDRVYAVWQDSRSGATDIYFNRSTDRGATWLAADRRLDLSTSAGNSIAPEICATGSVVHVVWEERRSSAVNADIFYNRSLDGGATWLAADVRIDTGVAPGAGDARTPRICCTANAVHVVWYDGRNGALDIYCNRSLDAGATWLASDVRLDTGDPAGAAHSRNPTACCQGGSVFVVWTDSRGGNDDVYCNRSSDGGTTWLPAARRIDHAPSTAFSADVQVACSGSDVHLVWEDDRSGLKDIFYNRSADGGSTWLPVDIRLDSDPAGSGDSHDPSVCCAGNAVYAVWTDYRSFVFPQVWLSRSTNAGVTWAPDVLLNATTANCFSANPSVDCDGTIVGVAWESQACGGGGNPDIFFARSIDLGATWLPAEVQLDTNGLGLRRSGEPRVRVDGNQCYVVWNDHRNSTSGRQDIYFNVPFGMLSYGAATPGTGGIVPRLSGNGSATLGSTISVDVTGVLGGAFGAALVGGPGSKASMPLLGGTLLVSPIVTLPLTVGGAPGMPGAGTGALPLALPASAAFVGWNANFQGVFIDAGATGGVSMSNAVELWIG